MSSKPFTFFSQDVGVKLAFTLLNARRVPFDLTDFTARLFCAQLGVGSPQDLVIEDPKAGEVSYVIAAAGFFPVGNYSAQIKVTNGVSTFRTPEFRIQSLPSPLTP